MGTYNGDSPFTEQSVQAISKDQHYSYPEEPVARSMVSANHWLRNIEIHTFLWQLTLVSVTHVYSNSGQGVKLNYILVKRIRALLHDQNKHDGKTHDCVMCEMCLHKFSREDLLEKHEE